MTTAKQRLLDIWLVESNTVYRGVPFVVVTDWLQQGRLLAEDCVRLAGSKKWHDIRAVPALAPYLPKAEPHQAQDTAEALEPVELGLEAGRLIEEEDEDVDMIPLIDISLVLLIFFMMTASVSSGIFTPIDTPGARHQLASITSGSYWVGVDSKSVSGLIEKDDAGKPLPWYSLGKEDQQLVAPTRDLDEIRAGLSKELQAVEGEVKVRLRAERSLPIETVRAVTAELQGLEGRLNRERGAGQRKLSLTLLGEVSEPKER